MSCPDCFRGAEHSHAGAALGTTRTMFGKTCYVASPPPSTTSPSPSKIIYITDAFGPHFINTQLLADRLAAETNCVVLVPDVIPGGGGPVDLIRQTDIASEPVQPWWDVWSQMGKLLAALKVAYYFVPLGLRMLSWASPQKAYPLNVLPFARAVRAELAPEAKLGVVGFCWGGYGATKLCSETVVEGGKERLIDVQFCGHPYGLTTPQMVMDAVKKFKVPFSVAIGDQDIYLGKDKVEETEAALRTEVGPGHGENGYNYEVKVYKGCTHGFVVRAKPGNQTETEAAEVARRQAVDWLKKYL